MSEIIGELRGEWEGQPVTLYVGAFHGGERRGPCIQLTTPRNDGVQLTEHEVRRLSKALDTWLFNHTLRRARNNERAKRD